MKTLLMAMMVMLLLAGCTGQASEPVATGPASAPAAAPVATTAAAPAAAGVVPEVLLLNQANPGERFELAPQLVAGQINIVDFYSEFCPPCVRIAPALEKLAAARADIVVRKLDINRAGTRGIDWGSPLARQYGLNSIPHFKIYDAQGKLMAEGDAAGQQVFSWLQAANISL